MVNALKLRQLTEIEVLKLNESEDFDEEWEKILYRICERDNYLTNKVVQISQLFNLIYKLMPEGEDLGGTINDLLALSSVTDVQAFDKPKLAINKGAALKSISSLLLPVLNKKLRSPFPVVRQQSKKIVSNLWISFSKENWKDFVGLSVDQIKENLVLEIWQHPWSFKYVTESMQNDIANLGLAANLEHLKSEYKAFIKKYPQAYFKYEPMEKSYYAKGWHVPQLTLGIVLKTLEDLQNKDFVDMVAAFILDFMDCQEKLKALSGLYSEKINAV